MWRCFLYLKRKYLRKKYKNVEFCFGKELYFRCVSKINKFRTKILDFRKFLYGILCFCAFYAKLLSCYVFSSKG